MTWFKVDDAFWSHPKVVAAGNAAIGLWLRCGTYAAQHLTDGFIPAAIAKQLGSAGSIGKLVAAGLWEPVDNRPGSVDGACGYLMHDWGDYQPYRSVALQLRENSAERQRKYREKHKVSEIRNSVTNSAPTRTRLVSESAGRHARPREPLRVVDEQ